MYSNGNGSNISQFMVRQSSESDIKMPDTQETMLYSCYLEEMPADDIGNIDNNSRVSLLKQFKAIGFTNSQILAISGLPRKDNWYLLGIIETVPLFSSFNSTTPLREVSVSQGFYQNP